MSHSEVIKLIMNLDEAIKELEYLGNGGEPKYTNLGICGNVCESITILKLQELWVHWPEYSGMSLYPVPHPKYDSHLGLLKTHNVWEGEYGNNRRKLCLWLADELEKELNQGK